MEPAKLAWRRIGTVAGWRGRPDARVRAAQGFLSLVWKVDDALDVNVKAERRVGQLDFGDFLSSVDIRNNASSGGNVDLVPEQSWVLSTEINKKLGPWGAVKLIADYRLIEDVVDQKLIVRPRAAGAAERRWQYR